MLLPLGFIWASYFSVNILVTGVLASFRILFGCFCLHDGEHMNPTRETV